MFHGWPRARTPALVAVRLHFAARNRAGRSLPPPGATCSLPHFRFAQMWPRARTPALAPVRSHFAPRNRAGRSPAPPFGFAAQNQARHFAARNHPVRLSASRPWLRHPAPLFCRPRHGSAAPGPQRQNPGACSHSVAFRLRRNRAAGRCPRRGQRARYPIFAPLKCGPAYSRGVCRGTFLCSTAGPALAPRRKRQRLHRLLLYLQRLKRYRLQRGQLLRPAVWPG